MDMKGNKGQGISMSMLVVMAIAILVLIIVALFFSGGFRRLGTNLISSSEGMADSDVSEAQMNCNQRCQQIKLEDSDAICLCDKCGDLCCDDDTGPGTSQDSTQCGAGGETDASNKGEDTFTCNRDCN